VRRGEAADPTRPDPHVRRGGSRDRAAAAFAQARPSDRGSPLYLSHRRDVSLFQSHNQSTRQRQRQAGGKSRRPTTDLDNPPIRGVGRSPTNDDDVVKVRPVTSQHEPRRMNRRDQVWTGQHEPRRPDWRGPAARAEAARLAGTSSTSRGGQTGGDQQHEPRRPDWRGPAARAEAARLAGTSSTSRGGQTGGDQQHEPRTGDGPRRQRSLGNKAATLTDPSHDCANGGARKLRSDETRPLWRSDALAHWRSASARQLSEQGAMLQGAMLQSATLRLQ
jgi:hypothetical protein